MKHLFQVMFLGRLTRCKLLFLLTLLALLLNLLFSAPGDWSKCSLSRRYLNSPLCNFGTSNIIIQAFILFKNCVSGDKRNCSMLLLVTHKRLGFISSYVDVSSSSSVYHMFICGRQTAFPALVGRCTIICWKDSAAADKRSVFLGGDNTNIYYGLRSHFSLCSRFTSHVWQTKNSFGWFRPLGPHRRCLTLVSCSRLLIQASVSVRDIPLSASMSTSFSVVTHLSLSSIPFVKTRPVGVNRKINDERFSEIRSWKGETGILLLEGQQSHFCGCRCAVLSYGV